MRKRGYLAWVCVGFVGLFLLTGCGYKPSAKMVQNQLSQTLSIEVIVDRHDPENTAFLRDELYTLIQRRWHKRVVPFHQTQSHLRVGYAESTFSPLSYTDGYVTRYRIHLKLHFYFSSKEGKWDKLIESSVEADIPSNSQLFATLKKEAMAEGISKALERFMAYVSAKSIQKESL